jgi:hypothetical protein
LQLENNPPLTNLIRYNHCLQSWAGNATSMENMINSYKTLFGRPEEKRELRKLSHRNKVNIKMDFK